MSAFLQQGRAIRQATASVDEDLRLVDPSLLIPVESPDPAIVTVDQSALSHTLRDASKAPQLSEFTVHDAGALAGIDPYVLGITA